MVRTSHKNGVVMSESMYVIIKKSSETYTYLKFNAVSWLTTGRPVAVASASLLPASSIWKGRSVALDTTCTGETKTKIEKKEILWDVGKSYRMLYQNNPVSLMILSYIIFVYFSFLHSCSILSYFVLFCPILFCSVLFCSVLSCSALSCSVLYYKISKHLFTDYHLFRHICLFIPNKPLHSTIDFYCLMSSLYFT